MAESSHGSPGCPLGSAGPLRCSPSPGAAGRALLEASPPRSGQDRGSRSGPATPALPQAGPRSTQHGVPSARLPGPRAHGLFHGWRSGRWGRALPRGWRASGHRTWPGTGAEQAESGPSPHPAPAGRAGSAGSLGQLLFHPPATPLHRPSRLQAPPPSGPGNCPHGSWPSPGRPLPTQPASADPQAAATPGRPPRPAWNQIQNLETREGPSCPCPAPAPPLPPPACELPLRWGTPTGSLQPGAGWPPASPCPWPCVSGQSAASATPDRREGRGEGDRPAGPAPAVSSEVTSVGGQACRPTGPVSPKLPQA